MTTSELSANDLRHFGSLLNRERDDVLAESARLDSALHEVREARSDGTADDEHDPDGSTMSAEWSQLAGLTADAAARLEAVDSALARLADGAYGLCANCGRPIPRERLDARPTALLCIDCARREELAHAR
ncbi:TraR/DksA family transcriptional regulator [Compostimonas suwonensis]|uniref:RNA polymerase-binding protein DksA n=1 Tax=Compostimonas suwonensis TaxID=1048394 RepID=A0A2M9BW07_9MICO|nr:TraR/DksA C4-type zinc finger protein [Compostimonas suwonensis]PJJ62131.1 RNA polymerase-binding protein DksA [Compostimonas suwonensis]